MAARFGEMLMSRRRQMGLSVQQVANAIKIKPQIIEFFEHGDFSSMPLRGYAQGMISSYARYLGLNPRMVVNAYLDDLRAYESAGDMAGGHPHRAAGSSSARSSSGETGHLRMAGDGARSRFGTRPPQAGYVSETRSGHEPQRLSSGGSQVRTLPENSYGRGRGARRSGDVAASGRTGSQPRSRTTQATSSAASSRGRYGSSRRPGDVGRTRNTGDAGRTQARSGRNARGARSGARGGRGSSGVNGRLLLLLIIAVLIIIVLVALLVLRGCTGSDASAAAGSTVSSQTVTTAASSDDEDTSDDDADADADADDATDEDASDEDESDETIVAISVDDGDSSWIEVTLDGEAVFGNEVYGPFEAEYTVTESIQITATTPGNVTVTENGEVVRWETKTSGVARITITAPETTDEDDSTADEDDATDTDDEA